ncbi:SURP and G-patch domain-containing protein 1-like isoform X1 [Metopolophium dirhodum]|uniref:SURP and G-patch domain-containing protein 1-like isoform X1 n=1 Tax=Metopolophium dirhodum TaxID=44670 RepID=UPI00298FA857|nr:SURP and G-patch domain-containing protein 1-like isoform X1 [Metopolophium dirhodum]
MFRNGKFSETTPSKQSRSERFQEMSKQQQLIEQKKREIQARFEEKKKKIAELTGENKSQQPLVITKNAIKLDKIKSFYQKSRSTKKNETSAKGSNEELPYESTGAHKNKPSLAEVFEKDNISDSKDFENSIEPEVEHGPKLESNYCLEAYKEPETFIPDHHFIGYNINQSYQPPNFYNTPSVQVTSIQTQPQTTVVQVPTVSIVTTHPILQISQPTSMYQTQNQMTISHGPYQQYPLQTPPLTATIVTDTTTTTTVPRNADEQPSLIVTETSTVSLGPTPDAVHMLNATPQTIETYTPVPRALNTVMRCEPQAVLDNHDVESLAATVAEYGDEIENIILQERPQDVNLLFLRDKNSPAYTIFRQRVGYLKAKMIANKLTPTDIKPQTLSNQIVATDFDSEDVTNKKRKRKSRWANDNVKVPVPSTIGGTPSIAIGQTIPQPINAQKLVGVPGMSGPMISQVGRNDPALIQYAMQSFGTIHLSEEDWKKAEDHYKINLLYQDMLKKRQQLESLQRAGKFKYEYDSDEDTEGGTWEHKLRKDEMVATERWAEELTEKSKDKHHIGDFLPPDELARFMEKYSALREDREPDLSDYKEFKLKEDNIGFQMLQKLGWSEGQGLGSSGTGIVEPVNKGGSHNENHGLGVERPSELRQNDDEFDAYRKRMMLAYRFRPNPLNNPRRPYY